ncbi:transporter accessory protein [Faecalicoccus pleomorphus]|uniref:Transporter accessory protein n=1 Tax=Faecalicoccus pleomorphus TaxID=1323 RepID=A0A7X9RJL2_9FIRM|nr:transporter accessory protein [Faecalicoccus pleomorphus]NME45188.1 transporter accessory protein [Faecalicoccus pleomorphus]
MNQRKVALFTLCTGIMICGVVLWILINKQQETKTETPKGCEEHSACSIDETDNQKDDWFIALTMEDMLQKLEDQEDGVYYFGYEDCPWCLDAAPVLKEVAQEHQKEVYYIKTRDEDHNLLYDDEQKERIINYLGEYMETNEDGQLTLYVPMVVEMKDGKVKNSHIGTVDSYDPNEREMTEEETKQLKDIYEAFFKE